MILLSVELFRALLIVSSWGAYQQAGDTTSGAATGKINPDSGDSLPSAKTIIEGQIVDALGQGVHHAVIVVTKEDDSSIGGKTQTDGYGDFKIIIEGRHPGSFKISIGKEGFVEKELRIDVLVDDLEPFVDITLQGALTIDGKVFDFKERRPVSGARVKFEALYRSVTIESDEAGRFEFENLLPGAAQITADAPGYGKTAIKVKVQKGSESVSVALKPERILRLTVVDDENRPVVGAALEIDVENLNDYRSEISDGTGQAVFRQLPFETQAVLVRATHRDFVASGRYDHRIDFPIEQLKIRDTIRLTPAAVLRGKVVREGSDLPINGARIDIGEFLDYSTPHAFSKLSGEYQIGSLPPGPTVVTISAAGYAPQLKVVEASSQEPAMVNFELGEGRSVRGIVVDSEGHGVEGADIEARKWRRYQTLGLATRSDGQGRFAFNHAPADEFMVNIHAPGFASLADQVISENRSEYEFKLERAAGPSIAGAMNSCTAKTGERCPSLALTTSAGTKIDDQFIKGKFVLFDFWATWCGPCIAELPTLSRIYDDFGRRDDFELLSISLDHDVNAVKSFISDRKLQWPQVFGPNSGADKLAESFGVLGLPCTILVGPDGNIQTVGLFGESLYMNIKGILKRDDD